MIAPSQTSWLGKSFRFVPSTGSTSDDALAWAKAGAPHGAVVVSDEQHAGRGRAGKSWQSPAGVNLYFSCVLRPDLAAKDVAPITLSAGLALARALEAYKVKAQLKWPNDLYVEASKLAGILTEMTTQGQNIQAAVVGVGLNVNQLEFPAGLGATSLALLRGESLPRQSILDDILVELEKVLDEFFASGFAPLLAEYRARAYGLGQAFRVGELAATYVDIDETGALVGELPDGQRKTFISGEVSFCKGEQR